MKRNFSMTTLVLLGIMCLAGLSAATELPAQEGRMWAPTGDLIGMENHATISGLSWDPHGNQIKYAEDWQQDDDLIFSGLFGFNTVLESGRHITVRGFGESGRGTFAGLFTLNTNKPGKCKVDIEFRNFNNFYDATSEMRASSFAAPPAPPSMDPLADMGWQKGHIELAYNLGKGFGLDLGFNRMKRDGSKGSLFRGDRGSAVPNTKVFDNSATNEFMLGASYQNARWTANAFGMLRQTDGDRALGAHLYKDEATTYSGGIDASYAVGGRTKILGAGYSSQMETENQETYSSSVYNPEGKIKTANGRLAVISNLGQGTTGRLSFGMGSQKIDHQTLESGAIAQATERTRESQDFGLLVTNNTLPKTRLRLDYRFRNTKLEETTALDNLPGNGVGDSQSIDQDRQSHRANLRAGIRLGKTTTLKAGIGWRDETIDQTNLSSGDPLFYTMGDRKQDRFSGEIKVQTRPGKTVRLDLGLKSYKGNFERKDVEDVKTSNSATRFFGGFNILASDRLTFVATGSYGTEKYETENGPAAEVGMSPLTYDGKTMRFAPGAIFQVSNRIDLEAQYEGVRFEDEGDYDNIMLKSDLDRMLLRAGYRFDKDLKVTATYRRHEFDENRWDDYIMDLYSLSVSGKF